MRTSRRYSLGNNYMSICSSLLFVELFTCCFHQTPARLGGWSSWPRAGGRRSSGGAARPGPWPRSARRPRPWSGTGPGRRGARPATATLWGAGDQGANYQSGYLRLQRLTWSVSSHSGRLMTHLPMIVFLILTWFMITSSIFCLQISDKGLAFLSIFYVWFFHNCFESVNGEISSMESKSTGFP